MVPAYSLLAARYPVGRCAHKPADVTLGSNLLFFDQHRIDGNLLPTISATLPYIANPSVCSMAPTIQEASDLHCESFCLGPFVVPRVWTGLWQLSSNAWGSAPVAKVRRGMARHVKMGYTAFGDLPSLGPTTIVSNQHHRYGAVFVIRRGVIV